MMNSIGWVLLAIAVSLVATEGLLRWTVGLGRPPLYKGDPEIGYLLAPNQTTRRSGNRIAINQFSMRSDRLAPQRPSGTLRVMLLGDSLVNGGWWTDQSQTLSALMQQQLEQFLGQTVEVLNVAANSWGPRNQLAYLRKFGLFKSQMVILLMNTDDLFATAPTDLPVGRDRNYPDRLPISAFSELLGLVLGSKKTVPGMDLVNAEPGDRVGNNLLALEAMTAIADQGKAQLILGITPLKREANGSEQREYEKKARQRLSDWAEHRQITLIDFLESFTVDTPQLYRDHIHLSPQGNQLVSDRLSQATLAKIRATDSPQK